MDTNETWYILPDILQAALGNPALCGTVSISLGPEGFLADR